MYLNHCICDICRLGVEHPEKTLHQHINLLMSRLDEQQRRWLAGVLAEQYGLSLGGVRLISQVTGLSEKTIRRGLKELACRLEGRPVGRERVRGVLYDEEWDGWGDEDS